MQRDDRERPRNARNCDLRERRREGIATSQRLAVRLADLARGIRRSATDALARETENGGVRSLMTAFQESLIHDLNQDAFADLYAQTIVYGLLSVRLLQRSGALTAKETAHAVPVTNPFLWELLEPLIEMGDGKRNGAARIDSDELGINDVVETLGTADLEAVLRDFDNRNPQEDPVIHFYELFLKEYDAKQRMRRGVFYTPKPVVSYIVGSVHERLQTEFDLEHGLADTTTWGQLRRRRPNLQLPDGVAPETPFVQILDPATGTGTFLVEVIDVIYRHLEAKWNEGGQEAMPGGAPLGAPLGSFQEYWNVYVPRCLLPRLYGYELLPTPYAVAHLKIGLKLGETGYRFQSAERVRVYLTNALESPLPEEQPTFASWSPALAREAAAANDVKRRVRFTVVIGNPPYAGVSANMTNHAQRLIDAYKVIDGERLNERKLWLQDDYVKFLRAAQVAIDRTGLGVVGYITNHGYLDNPTFRGMRQSLMNSFSRLDFLDLHGNATKRERSPDGSVDKNLFDIKQGVAIMLGVRSVGPASVRHADLWGSREHKHRRLASSGPFQKTSLAPTRPFYFFAPRNESARDEYAAFIGVTDLFPMSVSAPVTARDHFVVAFTNEELLDRVEQFRSSNLSDAEVRAKFFEGRTRSAKYLPGDSRGWKLPEARQRCREDLDWRERVIPCSYRVFDTRCSYWADWMVDWPRPELGAHVIGRENVCLVTRRQMLPGNVSYFLATPHLPIDGVLRSDNKGGETVFPLYCYEDGSLLGRPSRNQRPNISERCAKRFAEVTGLHWDATAGDLLRTFGPRELLGYAYAIFFSPSYRRRYEDQIRVDFPRIPLPRGKELFLALTRLGSKLVGRHRLQDNPVESGGSEWIGAHRGIESVSWSNNTVWIDRNRTSGFRGVAEQTWSFRFGAHQVCEKWLKDRKGRALSKEEIDHYRKIVVAVSETIRLMDEIDQVIDEHDGWPGAFRTEPHETNVEGPTFPFQASNP